MKFLLLFLLGLSAVHAQFAVHYDSTASDLDPASQGWTASEVVIGTDSDLNGFIDPSANVGPVSAGPEATTAWQIFDQLSDDSSNIPTYEINLTDAGATKLYDEGFVMSVRLRAKSNHNSNFQRQPWSGFFFLEFPAPLFSDSENHRIGFAFGLDSSTNGLVVTNEKDTVNPVILGPDSADEFHTITIVKAPGVDHYDWYVDNGNHRSLNISDGLENTGSNRLSFLSGTSGGTGGAFDLRFLKIEQLPIYVDADASDPTHDGSSWLKAVPDLQSALAIATAGDQIWVAEGTYYPDVDGRTDSNDRESTFALKDGVSLYGGFEVRGNVHLQRDPETHPSILSGDLDQNDGADFANREGNAYNVVTGLAGLTSSTILDGFTITAGNANGSAFPANEGGGLRLNEASPKISNCLIEDNQADFGGGNSNRSSSPSLNDCSFHSNQANNGGAGIFNTASSSPTLTNCSFHGNQTNSFGGGIANLSSSSPTLTNCSFHGNQTNSFGGGIHNTNSSPTLTNCSFQGNQANLFGGGIYNSESPSPTLTNCSFQGNQATIDGGGIYNSFSSPTLTNCSFQGNQATDDGGGIYNNSSSPTLTNCSFQGNQANSGGGIFNFQSSLNLTNCIIWNNAQGSDSTSEGESVLNVSSSSPTYSHCLIQNIDLSGVGTDNFDGTNPANDPLFVLEVDPLTAPHSTGGDLRLQVGSPAIDIGDNAANGSTLDLDGNPRIRGPIDLGALESNFLYVDVDASDPAPNGSSWLKAFPDLQSALAVATAGDQILVAEGTYYPDVTGSNDRTSTFALKEGVALYGGFEVIGNVHLQRDPGTHPSILSGDLDQNDGADFANTSENAYNVVTGNNLTSSTILDGFTITAGNANDRLFNMNAGGGLRLNQSSPSISNCFIKDNQADSNGGGAFIDSSSPTFTKCFFQDNQADNSGGGAFIDSSSPTFISCFFQSNQSKVYGGGFCNRHSPATFMDCSFKGNRSDIYGGGMANLSSSPTLANCSLHGNEASGYGGGMANLSSSPSLTNCSIQGNQAVDWDGGGIFNSQSSPKLTNCSIQGNRTNLWGGGMANYTDSFPTLTNCIIWSNTLRTDLTLAEASVINGATSFPTYSHCLIQNIDLSGVGTNNFDGTDPANDPLFVLEVDPLTAPNATGGDLRLQVGSPAIDIGENSANTSTLDLDGNPRIRGTIDLGALESNFLYVDVDASDPAPNGSSWLKAFPDLQSALAVATAGDQILVAEGTYHPDVTGTTDSNDRASTFALKEGVALYGGFEVTGNIHLQRNPETHPSILSGDLDQNDGADFANTSENAYNVVTGNNLTSSTILDGFTITAGNANGSAFPANEGGGLRLNEASPKISNCLIEDNQADFGGGSFFRSSSPTFSNCSFQGNRTNFSGAGIYCSTDSSAILTKCTIQDNRAGTGGGGIFSFNSSPSLNECLLLGNRATENGGGIFNKFSSPAFTNCVLESNQAKFGGGIYNVFSSPVLIRCSLESNQATKSGGGICNNTSSSPTLFNCTLQGNRAAGAGGGIGNFSSSPTLANCLLLSNYAGVNGGSIYNSSSSPTLINCSFQGNQANAVGGGIYNINNSSPSLTNCIIWNNARGSDSTSEGASVYNVSSSSPTYSHCLIQNIDLSGVGTNNFDGTDPANDPLFVLEVDPLTAPHATGGDLRLLTNSPALDAGNNSANSTTTDLAGNPRFLGTIDLGAHEGNIDATFALLHPGLDPKGDENNNGTSNFLDYALGGDPTAPHDPSLFSEVREGQFTYSFRNNATDVSSPTLQKSTTLQAGSWQDLIEATDFSLHNDLTVGGQTIRTIDLLNPITSENDVFIRQGFPTGP